MLRLTSATHPLRRTIHTPCGRSSFFGTVCTFQTSSRSLKSEPLAPSFARSSEFKSTAGVKGSSKGSFKYSARDNGGYKANYKDKPRDQKSFDRSFDNSRSRPRSFDHEKKSNGFSSTPSSSTYPLSSFLSSPSLSPSSAAAGEGKKRRTITPSKAFLMEREESMHFAKILAERRARAKAQEKAAALIEFRKERDSFGAPVAPAKPYQIPKVVSGDVAELFGAESTQNREVLPGDFVEIRKSGKPLQGIFMQNFDQAEGRIRSTSILQGDNEVGHRNADVVFRIPGFLFMDKAKAAVGKWDVDAKPTEPPVGTGKLADIFTDESTLLMGHFYTKFSRVYDEFWFKRKQTSLTTPEAAKFVFGKEGPKAAPLTLQEMYATHIFLTQDSNLVRFSPSVAVRWTGEFGLIHPKDVALTEMVIGWLRNGDEKVVQFLEKAKKIIQGAQSGEDRALAWKDIRFSNSDRSLIEFVRQAALNGYSDVFFMPHMTYLPKIIRHFPAYDDIDPQAAFGFLRDIGVWPQWYNMEVSRAAMTLDLNSGSLVEQEIVERIRTLNPESLRTDFDKDIALIKDKAAAAKETGKDMSVEKVVNDKARNPMVLKGLTDMYNVDPCDTIRHDFGTQAIYAIDDPSASELDDAFSIESVPITTLTPEPSTWVHVHVADPTSILPPYHELALLAAERVQTTYLPEKTWPMLPRAITEDVLSLKNDGQPKKVMTFSARLNHKDGRILEYKIRPGLVRNVVTLNYNDVDDVLRWDRVHGGKAEGERVRGSMMSMPETMTEKRQYYRATKGSVRADQPGLIEELQRLQDVSDIHLQSRLNSGAFNFALGRPMIELTPFPLLEVQESDWQRPIDYSPTGQSAPHIACRLDPSFASPARLMVSEYMVMAGRVAAKFAQERGLPVMYRNQTLPLEKYRDLFADTIRTKTNPLSGMLDMRDMLPLRPYISGAEISVNSVGHWSMGIQDGYLKVTSPLRRYSDMVSHWQIKGELLRQHDPHHLDHIKPAFALETLVPLSSAIRDRERAMGMLEARSVKFWLMEMLRRRKEAGLSMVFEGIILNPTEDGYNVMSTLLGFQNVVKAVQEVTEKVQIGDRVVFEVELINPQKPYMLSKHLAMA